MSTATLVPAPRPTAQPQPGPSARKALAGLASLAVNFILPLLAYKVIRPHTGSSAMAMALAGLIPVAWTLAILVIQRKLNVLGVVGVATFGLGVLATWATGGSTLAMELQDPALTGLFGLACLGSVAIGRPLHRVILTMMGRSNPRYTAIASRAATRTSMITTTILGLAFLGHAAALTVMALTEPASTFLALQQPVGLSFFGLGIGGMFLYHQLHARKATGRADQDQAGEQA